MKVKDREGFLFVTQEVKHQLSYWGISFILVANEKWMIPKHAEVKEKEINWKTEF